MKTIILLFCLTSCGVADKITDDIGLDDRITQVNFAVCSFYGPGDLKVTLKIDGEDIVLYDNEFTEGCFLAAMTLKTGTTLQYFIELKTENHTHTAETPPHKLVLPTILEDSPFFAVRLYDNNGVFTIQYKTSGMVKL